MKQSYMICIFPHSLHWICQQEWLIQMTKTAFVSLSGDWGGGREEIYFNTNLFTYLRTTCLCMPITVAGIAHCCWVTSLHFWTLQDVSPEMWIPTVSKATSYFLQWFYTFYSIKLKTSHPAVLWDKIFIIFSPSARQQINRNDSTIR